MQGHSQGSEREAAGMAQMGWGVGLVSKRPLGRPARDNVTLMLGNSRTTACHGMYAPPTPVPRRVPVFAYGCTALYVEHVSNMPAVQWLYFKTNLYKYLSDFKQVFLF